ncbi:Gfo/Idh/MocA family oxidoreductase [soil metagenome]
MAERKLRVGMVGGGGPANFFGGPHRRAILIDNSCELTAGALRSKPEDALQSAKDLFFPRGYGSWKDLIAEESKLGTDERIDYLTIVTPNHEHFGPAETAVKVGIAVLCEKPLTLTLEEARQLASAVQTAKVPFGVAYTYTGFPMVMLARQFVQDGLIGEVRKVEAWYPQGWLANDLEAHPDAIAHKQASWRVDPSRSGGSGCGGDIGTHAYEFIRFVAGLKATKLSARLRSLVPGRQLDDDFTVLAELDNGGIATIAASQITIGAQNDNGFRVIGTKGTLEWNITEHTILKHFEPNSPFRTWRPGAEYSHLPSSIGPYMRVPSGHPEGFHEALANLHRTLEWKIRSARGESTPEIFPHPDIADGLAGMAFIDAAVKSSSDGGKWVDVADQ